MLNGPGNVLVYGALGTLFWLLTSALVLGLLWLVFVRRENRRRRERGQADERRAAAQLRPRSGAVSAAPRRAPRDHDQVVALMHQRVPAERAAEIVALRQLEQRRRPTRAGERRRTRA